LHLQSTNQSELQCLLRLVDIIIKTKTKKSYVLSRMRVSKETIGKFLIGNRFHVQLRILSPFSI